MKIHITVNNLGKHHYHPSRKSAIAEINSDHVLFSHAIGCHYLNIQIDTRKDGIVNLLNNVSKFVSLPNFTNATR